MMVLKRWALFFQVFLGAFKAGEVQPRGMTPTSVVCHIILPAPTTFLHTSLHNTHHIQKIPDVQRRPQHPQSITRKYTNSFLNPLLTLKIGTLNARTFVNKSSLLVFSEAYWNYGIDIPTTTCQRNSLYMRNNKNWPLVLSTWWHT